MSCSSYSLAGEGKRVRISSAFAGRYTTMGNFRRTISVGKQVMHSIPSSLTI
jgi:hypothetical protein